ncbi:MAG: T9SS type A sorting domain-containing protein, partial [Candidatus Cloacimonetes bacterium]|nr:T9SS type A sorting domain-containing protein [Candidatus Cloacimonadota bacterium]
NEYLFEQAYFANNESGMLQLTSGGDPTINDFDIILGHRLGAEYDMDIDYVDQTGFDDNGFGNMLHRHEGYKVKVTSGAENTTLVIDGDRLPLNYELSEETLLANEYHWLGYWLPYSQDIDDAFGNFWQYVKVVKAENWTYADLSNPRGAGDPEPKPSMKIRPLEYGKGYLVKFTEDINYFHWNDTNEVSEPEKKNAPENFTYEEKADYEVIDVLEIDPSVTEIGVFEDGVCVGAVAIQDSSVQILVYSDNANRDPVPFTFEITTGRGTSSPIKSYTTLNLQTNQFEDKLVISGRQEYSAVKFGEFEEPENIITTTKLNGNYPNPFNPTTTISFSLPNEQDIELTIYNIRGQKVKTLYSGTADKGDHSMIWEGKNANNKSVSSGIYFYKLKTNENILTRKMIMLK